MTSNRRKWLKQSAFGAIGLGLSFRSLANEEALPRGFGAEAGIMNLGSNENPYGISPFAKKAITEMLGESNRYSFNIASLKDFKTKVASYYQLSPGQVLITAGSGEALNLLARYYSGGSIITANPTFGILPNTAKGIGTEVIEIPLNQDKVHDLDAMQKAITAKTRLVYICNPANPTTTLLPADHLRRFCEEACKKTIVLLDEAYMDYVEPAANNSLLSSTADNPNLIILRTFSKIHAMAGLRLGFVAAHPGLIQKLNSDVFGNTQFCTSVLTQTAVLASLKDEEHRKNSKEKNAAVRAYTVNELKAMEYRVAESHTNFIFFKLKNFPGDFAQELFDKDGIIVRSTIYPDGNWCRVSLGTMDEMKRFIKIFKTKNA